MPIALRTAKLTFTILSKVINPKLRFTTIYFNNKKVFFYSDFFIKYRLALKILGISTGSNFFNMLLNRVRAFS